MEMSSCCKNLQFQLFQPEFQLFLPKNCRLKLHAVTDDLWSGTAVLLVKIVFLVKVVCSVKQHDNND